MEVHTEDSQSPCYGPWLWKCALFQICKTLESFVSNESTTTCHKVTISPYIDVWRWMKTCGQAWWRIAEISPVSWWIDNSITCRATMQYDDHTKLPSSMSLLLWVWRVELGFFISGSFKIEAFSFSLSIKEPMSESSDTTSYNLYHGVNNEILDPRLNQGLD